jgi:hypothetical protein
MNSDKTLQSQINNASGKQNRQELLNKLHENINKKRDERLTVSPHVMKKLNKEVTEEKKQNDSDPRVTPIMKDYFIKALKTYPGYDMPSPIKILNSRDEYELKFIKLCIKLLKDNDNNSDVLDNPYSKYMREVLGLNN